MLFRVSQCLYRPLQRPFQPRIIEQIHIVCSAKRVHFQSADVVLRLLNEKTVDGNSSESSMPAAHQQPSTYMRNAYANAKFKQWEIERMNAHICWPTVPFPSRFIPNITAPADILAIERICLELVHTNSETNADYSCTVCNGWSAHCVIFFPLIYCTLKCLSNGGTLP